MADNDRKDAASPGDVPAPKPSGATTKSLSHGVAEGIKRNILFGDVGYKHPPKEHRFKKGQSGNPKGRPKARPLPMGDRSANALALKQAERLITVREGEEVKQIPAIEAVFRAQYATACKGNAYAQKHSIERYAWADRDRRQQIQASIDFWQEYVAESREAIAEAERKGEAPPNLLPHPDDMVIDPDTGVHFVGPIDDKELGQLKETCRVRDLLIKQDALDWRQATATGSDDPLDKPGTALLFAMTLNQLVPNRFKLSDGEIELRMGRYRGIPKRQLLKDLYRGWRSLGVRAPRGRLFPSLRVGKERLELLFDLAQKFRDGRLNGDSAPEELEAEIATIISQRLTDDELRSP